MASRQEKEQRAEAVARQAASDLSDVNQDREPERHEERPGVIGSVMKAVQSAKEAIVGKSQDEHGSHNGDAGYYAGDGGDRDSSRETTMMVKEKTESAARTLDEKDREMKERARERTQEISKNAKDAASETKDYTAEKAREVAERTKQTAESAKGKTRDTAQSAAEKTKEKTQEAKEKTLETSQSAVDKSKETAQSAAGKLAELKDKAMGLFSGKKEEGKEWMYEATGVAKEKPREVKKEARRRVEEMGPTDGDKYEGDLAGRVRSFFFLVFIDNFAELLHRESN